MKKAIVVITILCISLGVVIFLIRKSEDRTGPEITFLNDVTSYVEGVETVLLKDVKAIDAEDGDVSETLLISGIYPDKKGSEAKVVYLAKDKSNNVTTATRTVEYTRNNSKGETKYEDFLADGEFSEEQETSATEIIPSATITPKATVSAEVSAPVLTLTETNVTVERGAMINRLSYVRDIKDDKDERNDLFGQIQISGDVDTTEPGEYELIYYVVDSDANQSNNAKLVVVVK